MDKVYRSSPKNPASSPKVVGEPTIPHDLIGKIDPKDVDFFRVQAQAGQLLVADLVADSTALEPLIDPFLGLFDSNCNLIRIDDNAGNDLNARISFTVPSDGVFVLAASGCCDWSFDGNHWVSGSYILTISQAPEPSSVKGRVVDALTQMPLPGDSWPYAAVELVKCWDGYPDCGLFDYVGYQPTSAQGEFLFDSDYTGGPLFAGTYQVHAFALDYQPGSSDEPERLFLRPGESTEVEFEFDVPGTVPQGAYICADVGQPEDAHFFPLENQSLFCVYKGIADSLTVITGAKSPGHFRPDEVTGA